MKIQSKLSAIVCVLWAFSIFAQTQPPEAAQPAASVVQPVSPQDAKPTLAILPFIIQEGAVINISDDNNTVVLTSLRIETNFTGLIRESLVKSRKFNVLERDYLRKVIDENKITESEWAKPGEEQRIGKLLVSDYLVIGHIDSLQKKETPVNIGLTGEHTVREIYDFKIHFNITEVKSGKVVFAQHMQRKLNTRDIPASERRDMVPSDYIMKLFEPVAIEAANLILEGIFPIKVASINGDVVTLNRGEGSGLKIGDKLNVFNIGGTVKDPDTGEILGSEEVKIAEIEITSVQPKFSQAKVVNPTSEVKQGAICRSTQKAAGSSDAGRPAPEYPRATPGW